MLYCKNGRSRSLRRRHKPRGDSLGVRAGFSRSRGFLPEPEPYAGRAPSTDPARQERIAVPGRRTRVRRTVPLHHVRASIMQLTGAEITIRCLQEEGVEYVFGYPGGAVLNIYDELFKQDKVKHVLVRHEQGAVHAADGYSRSSTQGRRRARHVGSGRHQRGDRHRDRVHGLDPDGGAHGPGADARDRPGRVPGVRHRRHHAALRQAQLPRQGREGPRGHDQEGVLPRRHRPARARCWSTSRRTSRRRTTEFDYPKTRIAALVQPGHQGPRRARSRRPCSCCSRRSGRWCTRAAA